MNKFKHTKVYVLQDGKMQRCPLSHQTFAKYNYITDTLRDRRKLLLEISRSGNACLSFKDIHLELTSHQIQMIYGIWKNLKIKKGKGDKND